MDGELVKRRKIGGRAGKKKWKRQSNTEGLQLHDLSEARKMISEQTRKNRKEPSYRIQVEPDLAIKKRLDKDRFKEKFADNRSKLENQHIKRRQKIIEKRERAPSAPLQGSKLVHAKDDDLEAEFDLWDKDMKIIHKKPEIVTNKELTVPKILKPHAGQSYNPSFDDQLELMKHIVKRGAEKKQLFKTKSDKAQEKIRFQGLKKRAPIVKPRSQKEKEQLDEHAKKRAEKQIEFDNKNLEFYFNETSNKQRKHGRRYLTIRA